MYSVSNFGSMISDRRRTDAYREALRQAVKPGAVVIDIGTGTGIFALSACQFGAAKVYALEPGDPIEVARAIAQANGYGDRIEFRQQLSTTFHPPVKADVIVSDLRGVLPLFEQHVPSIVDARERLLQPGGILIPQSDSVWFSVVEAPELYNRRFGVWHEKPYGFDVSAAVQPGNNTWSKGRVKVEGMLTEPACWGVLDYRSITHASFSGGATVTVRRPGVAHGLAVWFDTVLADGIGYSNSPRCPDLIYGNAFFPWLEPVAVSEGDVVSVHLSADMVSGDYVWGWSSAVSADGRKKASFDQSTFFGAPLALDRLRKRAAGYTPRLTEDGRIDQSILALFDGRHSLEQVAQAIREHFPSRFASFQQALAYVADLSQRYGCHAESASSS